MTDIVTAIVASISPSALPIVVCVLGCVFIYLKIGKERKHTKEERDSQKDELDKRLTLVEHDVAFMKEQNLKEYRNTKICWTRQMQLLMRQMKISSIQHNKINEVNNEK